MMALLDDDINTIQLVGTSPKTTYVTGLVQSSRRTSICRDEFNGGNPDAECTGTILFNQLIATSGVKSIELNGFVLSNQVSPAVTTTTGIFLYGGVQTLSFQDIDGRDRHGGQRTPVPDRHRHPNTPLKVDAVDLPQQHHQPGVQQHVDHVPTTPSRRPPSSSSSTARSRTSTSSRRTREPIVRSGYQFAVSPSVGTTGRTSVQATAVDNLNVHGSAMNFTVSQASQPFTRRPAA